MEELVNRWVIENAENIKNKLEKVRQARSGCHQYSFDIFRYDYSEMSLCSALPMIPEPQEHILRYGFVERKSGNINNHYYYKNGEHIVCLTPGQFWYYSEHLTAGETVRDMQKSAPRLLRCLSGVYFLSGDIKEIFEEFGIMYA